jgi:hypothetical protein
MPTLSPGAIVTCPTLWVAVRQVEDGRWLLNGERGAVRVAGEGDITVIRSAPSYEPDEVIERGGRTLTVLSDGGDRFICETATVLKSDLMADALEALK